MNTLSAIPAIPASFMPVQNTNSQTIEWDPSTLLRIKHPMINQNWFKSNISFRDHSHLNLPLDEALLFNKINEKTQEIRHSLQLVSAKCRLLTRAEDNARHST